MAKYEPQWEGLTLNATRDEEQGYYIFYVELDGAQVVLGAKKLGGVDSSIATAKAAADEAAAAKKSRAKSSE